MCGKSRARSRIFLTPCSMSIRMPQVNHGGFATPVTSTYPTKSKHLPPHMLHDRDVPGEPDRVYVHAKNEGSKGTFKWIGSTRVIIRAFVVFLYKKEDTETSITLNSRFAETSSSIHFQQIGMADDVVMEEQCVQRVQGTDGTVEQIMQIANREGDQGEVARYQRLLMTCMRTGKYVHEKSKNGFWSNRKIVRKNITQSDCDRAIMQFEEAIDDAGKRIAACKASSEDTDFILFMMNQRADYHPRLVAKKYHQYLKPEQAEQAESPQKQREPDHDGNCKKRAHPDRVAISCLVNPDEESCKSTKRHHPKVDLDGKIVPNDKLLPWDWVTWEDCNFCHHGHPTALFRVPSNMPKDRKCMYCVMKSGSEEQRKEAWKMYEKLVEQQKIPAMKAVSTYPIFFFRAVSRCHVRSGSMRQNHRRNTGGV